MENPTKLKILAAAKTLFIEHGFAGTSIGKIAKLAQVNHSLVFHHFTNKENLWLEVKQHIIDLADNNQESIPSLDLTFDEFLQELFENRMHFYQSNPDLIRLLNWQRLESNENLHIGITKSSRMQKWIEAISHYQEVGSINNLYKPEFIVTFILSIIVSAALDPNIFIQSEQDRSAYIQFCIQCFVQGFSP